MDVSIIIVNYNTFALTCKCIESVLDKEPSIQREIILVDNNSSEIPAIEFKKKFPLIELVESPSNVGFAKGNNLGIARAKGDFILLLNSDAMLKNDAVSRCMGVLKRRKDVGVVTAKLEYPHGGLQHNCQRFPSVRYRLFELLRLQKLLGKRIGGRVLLGPFFDYHSVAYPDWVWGTFFMFRRHLLESLPNGKLADQFFMYGEDIQWCLEIKRIGYRIAFEPGAVVLHHMGQSGGNKEAMMNNNMNLLMRTYYSSAHRTAIRILDNLLQ